MSHVSRETFQAFYDGQQDSRYGEFSQDFNLLASDDSVDLKELTDILDGDESYDKKRVAYEVIVACFPEEAKAIAQPQPSFMDSVWTAGGTFIDHYTKPFAEALDSAVDTYDSHLPASATYTDKAMTMVPALWSGADKLDDAFDSGVGIVSWVNPLQGVEEAADKVMKQDFEAGNRIDGTYATAAVVRTGAGVVDNIVNGAAAFAGSITYLAAVLPDGAKNTVLTTGELIADGTASDVVLGGLSSTWELGKSVTGYEAWDQADAQTASKVFSGLAHATGEYTEGVTSEVFGGKDAIAMKDFVWHVIKLFTWPLGIPYGIWETMSDPAIKTKFIDLTSSQDSETAFTNSIELLKTIGTTLPGKFFEYFGTDLQTLGGYDPNDPDSVSRWLNVIDTLASYILPFKLAKGSKAPVIERGAGELGGKAPTPPKAAPVDPAAAAAPAKPAPKPSKVVAPKAGSAPVVPPAPVPAAPVVPPASVPAAPAPAAAPRAVRWAPPRARPVVEPVASPVPTPVEPAAPRASAPVTDPVPPLAEPVSDGGITVDELSDAGEAPKGFVRNPNDSGIVYTREGLLDELAARDAASEDASQTPGDDFEIVDVIDDTPPEAPASAPDELVIDETPAPAEARGAEPPADDIVIDDASAAGPDEIVIEERGEPGDLHDHTPVAGADDAVSTFEEGHEPGAADAARVRIDPSMLREEAPVEPAPAAEAPVEAPADVVPTSPALTGAAKIVDDGIKILSEAALKKTIGQEPLPAELAQIVDAMRAADEAIKSNPSDIPSELIPLWNEALKTFDEQFSPEGKGDGQAANLTEALAAARRLRAQVVRLGQERGVLTVDEITMDELGLNNGPSSVEADPIIEDLHAADAEPVIDYLDVDGTSDLTPSEPSTLIIPADPSAPVEPLLIAPPIAPAIELARPAPAEPAPAPAASLSAEPAPVAVEPAAPAVESYPTATLPIEPHVIPEGSVKAYVRQGKSAREIYITNRGQAFYADTGYPVSNKGAYLDPKFKGYYGKVDALGEVPLQVKPATVVGDYTPQTRPVTTDVTYLDSLSDSVFDPEASGIDIQMRRVPQSPTSALSLLRDSQSGQTFVYDALAKKVLGEHSGSSSKYVYFDPTRLPSIDSVFMAGEGNVPHYLYNGQLHPLPETGSSLTLAKGKSYYVENGQLHPMPAEGATARLSNGKSYYSDGRSLTELPADQSLLNLKGGKYRVNGNQLVKLTDAPTAESVRYKDGETTRKFYVLDGRLVAEHVKGKAEPVSRYPLNVTINGIAYNVNPFTGRITPKGPTSPSVSWANHFMDTNPAAE